MIELDVLPKNEEHVTRLLAFCAEIVGVCDELGIEPILSSSLAVFAYTGDRQMIVNDVDLSCSEDDFARLAAALQVKGTCQFTDWHVLQIRRNDLKVEFDAREFWMRDLPDDNETVSIGPLTLKMVGLKSLKELYRRGLEATAGKMDQGSVAKHLGMKQKYDALVALDGSVRGITAADQSQLGREWLASLPALVETMSAKWGLEVEVGAQDSGFNAVVMRATRNGEACVLKLDWPIGPVKKEARALDVWRGNGAVLLLDSEPEHGALLLESLDSGKTLTSVPVRQAAQIAGVLIRSLAIPSPGGFRTLTDRAAEVVANLQSRQSQLGDPVPAAWLSIARDLALDLGPRAGAWMVHGDLHYGNVLAGIREPWLAIDPKPITGDPEFAVPELMWTRADELKDDSDVERLMSILVASAELKEDVARGWTIVRCVDYWLWGLENGLTEDPKRCERILKVLI